MTAQIPQDREHIVDLLPAYINGQLDAASARQVREHLVSCATCQLELATWRSIQGATQQIFAATPLPSPALMSQVWEKIGAEQAASVARWSPLHLLRRLWLVFRAQIPLIHKSIWVASALVCLFGLLLTLQMMTQKHVDKHAAADVLVLFIVVVGASGSAFIYGSSVDPGFELTLSTPTSVRLVMLCRMAIVLGYNFLLGLLASALFATVYGGSLWGFMQLWLGPLLFLSSLCLALSLLLGSAIAMICAVVIETLQSFPAKIASHLVTAPLPTLDIGPTSPALLIAALLLIGFAIFFVPKQPRLAG
jgi:hypothetical protein